MNSLRYLVSPDGESPGKGGLPGAIESSSSRATGAASKLSGSAIKNDPAPRDTPFIWRVLFVLFGLLHLTRPSNSSPSSSAHGRAKLSTTKTKKARANSSSASLPPIPRLFANRERKLLVLDLDETLVHSMTRGHPRASQMVEVHLRNSPMASFYYVAKRPFCIDFLTAVLQWYDVAIYTASVCEYADPIIDLLERDIGWRCFKQRLYRDSCIPDGNGGYIKDLTVLEKNLSRILLVDNSPISFAYQRSNGLTIEGWISDPSDRTLLQLLPLLFALRHTSDVRSILSLHDSNLISPKWR